MLVWWFMHVNGLGHKVGEFEKVLWFRPWLLLVLCRFYVYWFWFIRLNRFLILDLGLFALVCICLTAFSVWRFSVLEASSRLSTLECFKEFFVLYILAFLSLKFTLQVVCIGIFLDTLHHTVLSVLSTFLFLCFLFLLYATAVCFVSLSCLNQNL